MLQEETIDKSSTGYWGRADCEDRSEMALEKFPMFFNDSAHLSKVDQVLKIVEDFFRIKKGVYVNRRIGTNKSGPFTAIKVDNPLFPNAMKQTEKNKLFYDPLDALGVVAVYNKGTNSYIFRVR